MSDSNGRVHQEIVLNGWMRYLGKDSIRFGRVGEFDVTVCILRVVGQPFGNQHRVCIFHEDEAEELRMHIQANNGIPVPVSLTAVLFSFVPGSEVYLVAARNGIQYHRSDDDLVRAVELRQAVVRLMEEEVAETVKWVGEGGFRKRVAS
jgi:hypothetical protein